MASKTEANTTTDHDEIRRWAEQRGGQPACVKGTGDEGDIGILRLDFPGFSGEESLQHISWDDWFEKFDERGLALLYQEQTAGGAQSNFNKIVSRETAEASEGGRKRRSGSRRSSSRASSGRSNSRGASSRGGSSTRGRSASKKAPAKKAAKSAGHRGGRSAAAAKSGASKKSASAGSKRTAAKKTSSRSGVTKKSAGSRGGSANRGKSTRKSGRSR